MRIHGDQRCLERALLPLQQRIPLLETRKTHTHRRLRLVLEMGVEGREDAQPRFSELVHVCLPSQLMTHPGSEAGGRSPRTPATMNDDRCLPCLVMHGFADATMREHRIQHLVAAGAGTVGMPIRRQGAGCAHHACE